MNIEVGKVYRVKEAVLSGGYGRVLIKRGSIVEVTEIDHPNATVLDLSPIKQNDGIWEVALYNLEEIISAPSFERNIRSLLITLSEQDRLTCEVCNQLGIDDYCQSRDCVDTIIEWAKETPK